MGLTIAQFAKMAHIGTGSVKSLESGKGCQLKTAEKVASFLGKPVEKVFKKERTGGHLSPKTIFSYHAFISSVLESAYKWQLIDENPCRRVDPPKVIKHDIRVLDDEEVARLLIQLQKESIEDQALFMITIYTGVRRGELLGLEWEDIDFDSGVISICRTSQYKSGEGMYEDDTKTERSKRSIHVPDSLLDILRAYRAYQNERRLSLGDQWFSGWADHPRLFTSRNGSPMCSSIPLNRLKRILNSANLPQVSLHSLRHTNASLLIEQGVNVRTVSSRLGHSQTSTTLNIYTHAFQSADASAAQALELSLKAHA